LSQEKALEEYNPFFKERELITSGQWTLIQDQIFVRGTGGAKTYVQFAIEPKSGYAFADIQRGSHSQDAIFFLKNKVEPYFKSSNQSFSKVITPSCKPYNCNSSKYRDYLNKSGVELITSRERNNRSAFSRYFRRLIKNDLIEPWLNEDPNIDSLRQELESWMLFYNRSNSKKGFPWYGTPPIKTIENLISRDPYGKVDTNTINKY
jgi:hypothetical protein